MITLKEAKKLIGKKASLCYDKRIQPSEITGIREINNGSIIIACLKNGVVINFDLLVITR